MESLENRLMAVNPTTPATVREWPGNESFVGRVGDTCLLPDGRQATVVGNDAHSKTDRPTTVTLRV